MVVEMVPLKGGIGSIFHPPEGKDYKWYILPIGGLYATYHLLGEPETTIDLRLFLKYDRLRHVTVSFAPRGA